MTLDRWLSVLGLAFGIIGITFGYFSVTNESFRRFLIKRGIGNLPMSFSNLAQEYKEADRIPDDSAELVKRPIWDSRVRRKDVLAEGLFRFAEGGHLDRKILASSQDDGYVVALAKLVTHQPKQGDVSLLAQAVKCRVPAHTDYRMLEAIDALATQNLIGLQERNEVDQIVEQVAKRLGDEGTSRVAWTRENLRAHRAKP